MLLNSIQFLVVLLSGVMIGWYIPRPQWFVRFLATFKTERAEIRATKMRESQLPKDN